MLAAARTHPVESQGEMIHQTEESLKHAGAHDKLEGAMSQWMKNHTNQQLQQLPAKSSETIVSQQQLKAGQIQLKYVPMTK